MMIKGKILAASIAAFSICASVFGGDFYLKSGVTDWSLASSYCTDAGRTVAATSLPGSSDSIHVPAEKFTFDCATATGLASLVAASNSYEIITSEGSELEFIVPDNVEVGIGCRVRFGKVDADRIKSTLTKKGGGILSLLAGEDDGYLYSVNFDVQGGGLRISQGTPTSVQKFGWLKMATNTTVWLPCSSSSPSQAYFQYIMAEEGSLITNATTRADGHILRVSTVGGLYNTESYIKGAMGGKVLLSTVGSVRLDGTNNTIALKARVSGNKGRLYQDVDGQRSGVLLVKKLGKIGESSSLGSANSAIICLDSTGGGIRYTGTGETTDRTFEFYQSIYGDTAETIQSYPAFFDAGPYGGITFTGSTVFAPKGDASNRYAVRRLWLTGDNLNECVVAGGMDQLINGGVSFPVFLTKAGTGTWRFTASESRYHIGGTAILDGTLKFDSIDEKGFWTSLGDSSVLTTDDSRAMANNQFVDYAFTLGSEAGDPVLEYSGVADAICTTRPLVLAGKGGHLRASNGRLTFGGVSARDENSAPTLTLDGNGTNELRNVSDGATGAKVGVVKDGNGSWTLAGDQTFTGDITVKDGALSVRAPVAAKYADYKWYRLSVAQIGPSGNQNLLQIRQICLFDKDGVRQNAGLTAAGPTGSGSPNGTVTIEAATIAPGQVYYDKSVAGYKITMGSAGDGIDRCFDGNFSGSLGRCIFYWKYEDGTNCKPSVSDRSTWIPIVMHLADSANPITHFDVQAFPGTNGSLPTRICLEASHDGAIWEDVYSNVDTSKPALAANMTAVNQWISDGTSGSANNRPLGTGITVPQAGSIMREYFSWYRLSVAKLGNGNTLCIRQIGLYDCDGNRLNSGLAMAETPASPSTIRTILGTVPAAGEVGYGASAAGLKVQTQSNDCGEFGACFTDHYQNPSGGGTAGLCHVKWLDASGTALSPDVKRRSSWIPIVMHLNDPAAVHHFDIQLFAQNSLSAAPVRILLEGSVDGEKWVEVFDNATKGVAFSNVPAYYNCWLSDGVQASDSSHARLAGTGMDITAPYVPDETAATQFPNGMSVQVLSNGVLSADSSFEVKVLKIDAKNAGIIDGLSFAANNGTLDIVNFTGDSLLPGTYVNCEGLANVANWTLTFDGDTRANRRAIVENGKIKVLVKGTMFILR